MDVVGMVGFYADISSIIAVLIMIFMMRQS
jgi:hypothetical protein